MYKGVFRITPLVEGFDGVSVFFKLCIMCFICKINAVKFKNFHNCSKC